MQQLGVGGQLGGDAHFQHGRRRHLFRDLGPNSKQGLELRVGGRSFASVRKPKNGLGRGRVEQLPGGGRLGGLLAGELFRKIPGRGFQALPLAAKTGTRHGGLEPLAVRGRHLRGQDLKMRGGQVRCDALHQQLDPGCVQVGESGAIHAVRVPAGKQLLQPALRFKRLQDLQRVFLGGDLFKLIAALKGRKNIKAGSFFRIFVASRGPVFPLPAEPAAKPHSPYQPRRILEKAVIARQPKLPCLDIRDAVERVEQQAVGTFIERERHGVGGEIATAKVLYDRGPAVNGLSRLWIRLRAGARHLHPNRAGEPEVEGARRLVVSPQDSASRLQRLLEIECVALHGKIKVANRRAGGEIANGAAGQKNGHAGLANSIANVPECAALRSGEAGVEQVGIFGHASRRTNRNGLRRPSPASQENACPEQDTAGRRGKMRW